MTLAVHLADTGKLHGIRCNRYHRRHKPITTHDHAAVTCSTCLGLLPIGMHGPMEMTPARVELIERLAREAEAKAKG